MYECSIKEAKKRKRYKNPLAKLSVNGSHKVDAKDILATTLGNLHDHYCVGWMNRSSSIMVQYERSAWEGSPRENTFNKSLWNLWIWSFLWAKWTTHLSLLEFMFRESWHYIWWNLPLPLKKVRLRQQQELGVFKSLMRATRVKLASLNLRT